MSSVLGGPRAARPPAVLSTRVLSYLALALGLGALTGVLWWQLVDLPGYVVQADGGATTSERELASFVAADAWFTLLGAVVGAGLGWLAWIRLRHLGWPVVLVAAVAALAAGVVCWCVGSQLGPSAINPRLAAARPGDTVVIELTLRAKASLLAWPFAATVPVLLGSSLGADDEEPRPLRRPKRHRPVFRRRSQRAEQQSP